VSEPVHDEEVLQTLPGIPLHGRGLALLHHGERAPLLAGAIASAGARLYELCLCEWRLPDDTAPLEALIGAVLAHELDAVVFTAQVQVRHRLQVATRGGREGAPVEALSGGVAVAAVGPTTVAALGAARIRVAVVPSNPKMGPMVSALAAYLSASSPAAVSQMLRSGEWCVGSRVERWGCSVQLLQMKSSGGSPATSSIAGRSRSRLGRAGGEFVAARACRRSSVGP